MELAALDKVITGLMNGLPEEVTDSLADVEVLVVETPADGTKALIADARDAPDATTNGLSAEEMKELTLPDDCKGVFLGDPMEKSDDDDPTADESETVYDPEGYVVFCASNIADADEAVLVFLHEIGHALGLDEDEVKALSLGVAQAKEGSPNAPEHTTNG